MIVFVIKSSHKTVHFKSAKFSKNQHFLFFWPYQVIPAKNHSFQDRPFSLKCLVSNGVGSKLKRSETKTLPKWNADDAIEKYQGMTHTA